MMPKPSRPEPSPLAIARQRAGLTQQELAVKAGVSVPTIRNMERGMWVTTTTRDRLALALGVKAASLQP